MGDKLPIWPLGTLAVASSSLGAHIDGAARHPFVFALGILVCAWITGLFIQGWLSAATGLPSRLKSPTRKASITLVPVVTQGLGISSGYFLSSGYLGAVYTVIFAGLIVFALRTDKMKGANT